MRTVHKKSWLLCTVHFRARVYDSGYWNSGGSRNRVNYFQTVSSKNKVGRCLCIKADIQRFFCQSAGLEVACSPKAHKKCANILQTALWQHQNINAEYLLLLRLLLGLCRRNRRTTFSCLCLYCPCWICCICFGIIGVVLAQIRSAASQLLE